MSTLLPPAHTGLIEIDLDRVAANIGALARVAGQARLMAVVKADAYGHGLVPLGRAAVAAGADWLGAAQLPEALALRAAGITVPIFTWLFAPGTDLTPAVAADLDLGVSAEWSLSAAAEAATRLGRRARVHLKLDTGMARAGATPDEWPALVTAARHHAAQGSVDVIGIWSHLVAADEPGHPTIAGQQQAFADGVRLAAELGVSPPLRHLANSAATLTLPALHHDLVRPGLACYGLTPLPDLGPPARYGLTPALTLSSRLTLVKQVGAGHGVSYGHSYVTERPTTLGLVPLGYGDGIPRHASNRAEVWVNGRRAPVRGRVCMDQFVVDLGPESTAAVGDRVVLIGSGDDGAPTAQDWADACGTISYEIVTRLSGRLPRRYVGALAEQLEVSGPAEPDAEPGGGR